MCAFSLRIYGLICATALLTMVGCRERRVPVAPQGGTVGFSVTISDSLLRCDPDTVIRFGRVHEGEIVEYTLSLRNGYAEPLLILGVSASCGCTAVEFERKPIPAGGDSRFTLRFDSRGMYGRQRKTLDVQTSASPRTYRFYVEADVVE